MRRICISIRKRTLLWVGPAAAALLLLVIYRWRGAGFDWSRFVANFRHVRWGWLSAAIGAILLAYAGRALRWAVMVQPLRPNPNFWNILKATLIGFTAIVLFGRVGELVRPYLISLKEGLPFSSQMATWLLERMIDLLMILLIFGIGLAQVSNSDWEPGPHLRVILETAGIITVLTGMICLSILFALRYFSERMQHRIASAITFLPPSYQERIGSVLSAFAGGFASTRQNGFVGRLVFWSIVEWALLLLCFLFIFHAFPATSKLALTDVIIFLGFVSMGSVIQIPGVGGGVQVAAILVFTELFRYTLDIAAALAIVVWVVTFVVVVPFGLALAFHEGLKWRNLRHIGEESSNS